MTANITEVTSTLEIKIGIGSPLNMQTIADAIKKAYPSDPKIVPVGIAIQGICITSCKSIGEINVEVDTNNAASRLYNAAMQSIYQPIWNLLYAAYNALKHFGLAAIDLTIPYFGLHLSDLFNPNFYCNLYDIIKKLFPLNLDFLKNMFKGLGIPWPIYKGLDSVEEKIKYIINSLISSFWDQLMKRINTIIDLIKKGLQILDSVTPPYTPKWSLTWQSAFDLVLDQVKKYLTQPPSLQEIYEMIKAYAKKLLKKAELSFEDLIKALESFHLPILGRPIDWTGDLFKHIKNPELSFVKILNDIKLWIKNYIANLILKFIELVMSVLKMLGISFSLPPIKFPMTLCVIKT